MISTGAGDGVDMTLGGVTTAGGGETWVGETWGTGAGVVLLAQ